MCSSVLVRLRASFIVCSFVVVSEGRRGLQSVLDGVLRWARRVVPFRDVREEHVHYFNAAGHRTEKFRYIELSYFRYIYRISKYRLLRSTVSKCRTIEVSIYRIFVETSIFLYIGCIERVLSSIPWHPCII